MNTTNDTETTRWDDWTDHGLLPDFKDSCRQAWALHAQGMNIYQISKIVGISPNNLRRACPNVGNR